MVRTQVQLTKEQQAALRKLSASTGRSMADLVRDGIERLLSTQFRVDRQALIERALRVSGRFSSGTPDGSAQHDHHLAEAYR